MEVEIPADVPNKRRASSEEKDEEDHKKARNELTEEEIKCLEMKVLGSRTHFVKNLYGQNKRVESDEETEERAPVWHDEDDDNIIVEQALANCRHEPLVLKPKQDYQSIVKSRYKSVVGTPSWASLSKKHSKQLDEDDVTLLQRCGAMVKSRHENMLARNLLSIKRLPGLNSQTMNEGRIVTSVDFHKSSSIACVAGNSGVASVFQVDGKGNDKLASVSFKEYPIKCAKFSFDGTQLILGSNAHSHFYVYDLMEGRNIRVPLIEKNNMKNFEVSSDGRWIAVCGRFGDILLLSGKSKEQVATLHMNGNVKALAFSPDSLYLYAYGDEGEIWVFDTSSRRCLRRVEDEGCLEGCSLATSEDFIAAGSSSGVVNLYERKSLLKGDRCKPMKAIMNLVTPITSLKFDSTQQILAMSSFHKDESLKMFHIGSLTVFSNFPYQDSGLHKVQEIAFSPNSGYFSATNNQSSAFLFRLKHFHNY